MSSLRGSKESSVGPVSSSQMPIKLYNTAKYRRGNGLIGYTNQLIQDRAAHFLIDPNRSDNKCQQTQYVLCLFVWTLRWMESRSGTHLPGI